MSHQVIITFDVDETQVAENAAKEAGRQRRNPGTSNKRGCRIIDTFENSSGENAGGT